jgi:hypothetical protein
VKGSYPGHRFRGWALSVQAKKPQAKLGGILVISRETISGSGLDLTIFNGTMYRSIIAV